MRVRGLVGIIAASWCVGCATTSPRFEQDVATSFVEDDMWRLTTPDVELYYPAQYREQALRVAQRASECLTALREKQLTRRDHGRALLFLTSANYNNAYVGGQALGEPLHSLNPLSTTDELFHWYGLSTAESGDIACHEMFHYAHFEQVENLWRYVNAIVGPVVPSQAFLERWFTEGVAQYYEGRLQRPTGRPHSPLYAGAFDSFVAARGGELGGGDLSINQRELLPYSGAYLTGLRFVEWLAERFGEEKLWELMDVQGRSVFSPFGATLRFSKVYGMSAGALVDEWVKVLSAQQVRARPADQKVILAEGGQLARLASQAATGALAVVSSGAEQVPVLRLFEPDGRLRFEQHLVRLMPDREWVAAGPGSMSGLSFTADGRFLFLVNDDLISRGDTRGQIWKIDAYTGEVLKVWQDVGRVMGGAVSGDGASYTYVSIPVSGGPRIVERDLASGAEHLIVAFPATVSVSPPAWNPAHERLAFSVLEGNGWNVLVREADGSLRHLTTDGAFNYGPRWADEDHLVFARTAGKYLQAHRVTVSTGVVERLSDSAYGIIDPAPVPSGVALVNRDGVQWSIDVAPTASLEVVAQQGEAAPPSRHEPPPLQIETDEAYSSLDQLFVPQLRLPGVTASLGTDANGRLAVVTSLSLSLSGRDRLARHSWAINGSFNLPTYENGVSIAYRNLQLAPWSVTINGGRQGYVDETYWAASASIDRSFFTAPLSLGFQTEFSQRPGLGTSRYLGPFLSLAWGAAESTAYGGVQRQLAVSFDVAGYPQAFGSDRNMVDLRASVAVAVPLPVSRRHSFVVTLTGRALPGAPDGALRVGGVSRGTALWVSEDRNSPRGPGVFLPGALSEAVRGFDDHVIRATQLAVATARYRYSFIIDRGFMSTFYLFPSIFFRQIDAELFGSAAATNNTSEPWARAAGATVFVRALGGGALPMSLYYQFAWRFDAALPPLHTVGFAFE